MLPVSRIPKPPKNDLVLEYQELITYLEEEKVSLKHFLLKDGNRSLTSLLGLSHRSVGIHYQEICAESCGKNQSYFVHLR
jgi:hypothetical protein